jgi:hypothetical protein
MRDNQAQHERRRLIGFAEVGVIFAAKTGERTEDRQSQISATAMGCSKFLSMSGGDSVRYFLKFCLHQKNTLYCLNSNE